MNSDVATVKWNRMIIYGQLSNFSQECWVDEGSNFPTTKWSFDLTPFQVYNFNYKEEGKMSLAKKYENLDFDDNKRLAIKYGAMREDGTLTDEGIKLLCQVLLNDEEIREKFYDGLDAVVENEEE